MASPYFSASNSDTRASSNPLIAALLSGDQWGSITGQGVQLSYSFAWKDGQSAVFSGYDGSRYGNYSSTDEANAQTRFGLNTTQQDAFRAALQSWSNVANLRFNELSETSTQVGDIRVAWTSAEYHLDDGSQAWGWAYYPGGWPNAGDVWLSTRSSSSYNDSWAVGDYNFEALIHELGHALGLKHPFSSPTLPANLENRLYTVMSYSNPAKDIYPEAGYVNGKYTWLQYRICPETPMVLDIAAMQYLYGANMQYHSGDDRYEFDPTQPFFKTLWDAGGEDTLSASRYTLDCVLDLTPGHYSSLRIAPAANTGGAIPTYDGTDALGIAYGCIIENAEGGSGNDTLEGNSANNRLDGNDGTDTVRLHGKLSDYEIAYDKAQSAFILQDKTSGRDGKDTLLDIEIFQFSDVSKTAEQLIQLTGSALSSGVQRTGSANADNLKGSVLADTLLGLAGNDTLSGLGGGDTLNGGDGLDTVVYLSASSGFQVKRGSSEVLVSENGVQDHLLQVERIQFSDKTLALDIDATAGKAYRVYQAAFNRTPDTGGLKYWISKMDGGLTLDGVASGFIASQEFKTLYGSAPSTQTFVSKLYSNVLHRAPDVSGYDYWVKLLEQGKISKVVALAQFSESPENQVGVAGAIQDGIWL